MGAASWVASAFSVFLFARIVPPRRPNDYLRELLTALAASVVFGAIATAFDFGGWRMADWRALLFVAFGSAACLGGVRAGFSRPAEAPHTK
jgi:hypothetical protein